jgi:tetratricopeptide (TPR) repeat protein
VIKTIGVMCLVLLTGSGCARVPYRVGLAQRDAVSSDEKPKTAADYNSLGVKYELAGQYYKAIAAYEKCLSLDNGHRFARTNMGNVLAKLGRFDEAETCYRAVLAEAPDNLAAANNLAWLLVSTGDARACEEGVELAARCFCVAEQAPPGVRAAILDTLAWGNYRLRRQSEALRYMEEAADLLGSEGLNNSPLMWGHWLMISQGDGSPGRPPD